MKTEPRVHISDEELALFVDNSLSKSRKQIVQKHLVECDRCRSSVVEAVKNRRGVKKRKSFNIYYLLPVAATFLILIFVPMIEEPSSHISYTKGLDVGKEELLSLYEIFIRWVEKFLH